MGVISSRMNMICFGRRHGTGSGRVGAATRPRAAYAVMLLVLFGAVVEPTAAQDGKKKSRVVVVSPDPSGTGVPVAPNERVGAVTAVQVNGTSVAVARIDEMPNKPDFNIITPANVSHPYEYYEDGPAGTTIKSTAIWVHGQGSGGHYVVRREIKRGDETIGYTEKSFPEGSQLVPDPPQPPGTHFTCPDALPVLPHVEALILAELGIADAPETQVWSVPSTEFLFSHDAWFGEPEIVKIGADLFGRGGAGPATPPAAAPTSIWKDGFERYDPGSGLHGQGGWKGWDNDPALDAYVSDSRAFGGTQSVDVSGDSDLVHEFSRHSTSSSLAMSTWQFIPSDFQSGGGGRFAGSYFVLMNTYSDGGPHEEGHWSVQMQFDSNDGMLKVYYGNGLDTVQVPYETDRWVPIEIIIDLENDWTQVYYDDNLVTEYSWTGGVLGDGGGASEIAAVDLYAGGSTSIFYDDLNLEPLPR